MNNRLWARIVYVAAGLLATTSGLKVALFFLKSPSYVELDPVLGLVTTRESLLLSSIFEMVIAFCLLRSRSARAAGFLILYFSLCATIYQIGHVLQVQSGPPCSCLGVVSIWLDNSSARVLTRVLLLGFWLAAGRLLIRGVPLSLPDAGHGAEKAAVRFLLIAFVVAHDGECSAAAVKVEALYEVSQGVPVVKTRRRMQIRGSFDGQSLTVSTMAEAPQRYGGALWANTTFIDKEVMTVASTNAEMNTVVVGFRRPDFAWTLGNCAGTAESCLFLMIRCLDLFPEQSERPTRRRMAPPWTTIGEPLSVTTIGEYSWQGEAEGRELICDLRTSADLLANWQSSEFLEPSVVSAFLHPSLLEGRSALERAKRQVNAYPVAHLVGHMRFRAFTNFAGCRFPLEAEFLSFGPPTTNTAALAGPRPRQTIHVLVNGLRWEPSGVISILPVVADRVEVTDERLVDRELGVSFGHYVTNAVDSAVISPSAISDFHRRVDVMRFRMRKARLQKVVFATITCVILLCPAGYALVSRFRRARAASSTCGAANKSTERERT